MPRGPRDVPGPVGGDHLVRQSQGWRREQVHFADVRPDHAPALFDWVAGNRHAIGQRGLLAFDGYGGTLAIPGVAEPVVPALQLLALDGTAFRKRRSAVRTAVDEHVWLTRSIAPQRQFFTQPFDTDRSTVAQVS